MTKLAFVLLLVACAPVGKKLGENSSGLSAPICHPACDAAHYCFQLVTPPGQLRPPPTCIPR